MRFMIIFLAFVALTSPGYSTTYYVPDHFSTIQGAISDVNVVNNDIIIVRNGTYVENLNFLGKAITVKSENGPGPVTINGGMSGPVVTFNSGEGNDTVLEGCVLVNGAGALSGSDTYGAGIYCDGASSPTIFNNIIPGNSADYGAAIACLGNSHPIIEENQLVGNSAAKYGAAVFGDHSNAVVRNNFIAGNGAVSGGGGIFFRQSSNPIIEGNTLTGNSVSSPTGTGGAILLMLATDSVHAVLRNNQIYGNSCAGDGGGVYLVDSSTTAINNTLAFNSVGGVGGGVYISGDAMYYHCELRDNIIWGNMATTSNPQIYAASGAGYAVNYCDVEGGWPGAGNINADPLFINGFYLSHTATGQPVDSPCIDAGSNLATNLGLENGSTRTDLVADTGVVDMGYHEGPYSAHTLDAYTFQISLATGGAIPLTLLAGADMASRNYMIFGGVTGASPGTPLPGGFAVLPINWDAFTNLAISFTNTSIFVDFMGTLDSAGLGKAAFDSLSGPHNPNLAGLQMFYAYALVNPLGSWDFASNPVMIEFVQ